MNQILQSTPVLIPDNVDLDQDKIQLNPGHATSHKHRVVPYAFVRFANEITTAKACLESLKQITDRGVLCYHEPLPGTEMDGTLDLVLGFVQANPGFKLVKYPIPVLFHGSEFLFVNFGRAPVHRYWLLDVYYNYALLHLIKLAQDNGDYENAWLFKVDLDHVYSPKHFEYVMREIEKRQYSTLGYYFDKFDLTRDYRQQKKGLFEREKYLWEYPLWYKNIHYHLDHYLIKLTHVKHHNFMFVRPHGWGEQYVWQADPEVKAKYEGTKDLSDPHEITQHHSKKEPISEKVLKLLGFDVGGKSEEQLAKDRAAARRILAQKREREYEESLQQQRKLLEAIKAGKDIDAAGNIVEGKGLSARDALEELYHRLGHAPSASGNLSVANATTAKSSQSAETVTTKQTAEASAGETAPADKSSAQAAPESAKSAPEEGQEAKKPRISKHFAYKWEALEADGRQGLSAFERLQYVADEKLDIEKTFLHSLHFRFEKSVFASVKLPEDYLYKTGQAWDDAKIEAEIRQRYGDDFWEADPEFFTAANAAKIMAGFEYPSTWLKLDGQGVKHWRNAVDYQELMLNPKYRIESFLDKLNAMNRDENLDAKTRKWVDDERWVWQKLIADYVPPIQMGTRFVDTEPVDPEAVAD